MISPLYRYCSFNELRGVEAFMFGRGIEGLNGKIMSGNGLCVNEGCPA